MSRPEPCYLERRMPWRVAVYYWESGDMRVLPLMNALAAFFLSEKQVRPCALVHAAQGPWTRSFSVACPDLWACPQSPRCWARRAL